MSEENACFGEIREDIMSDRLHILEYWNLKEPKPESFIRKRNKLKRQDKYE